MRPKFTTPCFIRKNTPELRKKLEEVGYLLSDHVKGRYTRDIYCYDGHCFASFPLDCPTDAMADCGENEELFLALAALRSDSDKFQWFCDGNGLWEMSDCNLPSRYMQMNGHKATVTELIAHFKER